MALYQKHCAECHLPSRLGGMGPALLPVNLKRLKQTAAAEVIAHGRPATQMPAFSDKLKTTEIRSLVDYIYTPLPSSPIWGLEEIRNSRIVHHGPDELPAKPLFEADIANLFIVVELADHHATLLDGDRLAPIYRFPTRFALHGGPKFAAGGQHVYFASRDGWISKFDIFNLTYTAEIRAGINTRNLAVSGDGRYVMVANYLPHSLVLLDARDLNPIKVFDVKDDRNMSSRVSAVYTAAPRQSFIAALKDIPEVWEIPYSRSARALPIYRGPMHDYREDSGEAPLIESGDFPVRRIRLNDYLDDFFVDAAYQNIIGAARDGKGQVVNLDVGAKIADLDLAGLPHLGSGITWNYQGTPVLATPNLKHGTVSIIDTETWEIIKRIETKGPGFFLRSHENSPYAWVDVFFGPNKDLMHVIDKQRLEIVKTLNPAPGKTSAHVEFTKDGKYALVSIWDDAGALIVYDARTLQEVKRLPMRKPSGKYNVHNKLTRSSGTSH